MSTSDFEPAVERTHQAWAAFVTGDPGPAKKLYSHGEDVTLANPFGPPVRGWKQVSATMERAAEKWREGVVAGFERVTTYVTPELAYIIEVERYQAKIGGGSDLVPVALRVTSILRPEEGTWKLMHRHADAITTARQAESVTGR